MDNLVNGSEGKKQRDRNDEQRIQGERSREISVEQLVGGARPPAHGAMQAGQRMKKAARVKNIPVWCEEIQQREQSHDRQQQREPIGKTVGHLCSVHLFNGGEFSAERRVTDAGQSNS